MSARNPAARGKTDANQSEIIKGLTALGYTVITLSGVGGGCPDICVGGRNRMGVRTNWLLEIKVPRTGKKTKDQNVFFSLWGGQAAIVRSLEDCVTVINAPV